MDKRGKLIVSSFFTGVLLSLIVTVVTPYPFHSVFWGSFGLAFLLSLAFFYSLKFLDGRKFFIILILSATIFRVGCGVMLTKMLPNWGYDEETYKNGYIFRDAYQRDGQAWQIVSGNYPIFLAFTEEFVSDQYGGLLAFSALIYKIFTPLAHVQANIILVAVLVNMIGAIWFLRGLKDSGEPVQKFALILYLFFPDAILLGVSQMREPFLIGFSAILFGLLLDYSFSKKVRIVGAILVIACSLLVSYKIGIFLVGGVFLWYFLHHSAVRSRMNSNRYIFIGLVLFILMAIVFSSRWLNWAGYYDSYLTVQGSGWLQSISAQYGNEFMKPFLTIYGILRPVLPATLFEPSLAVTQIISIFRALGWALIFPLYLFGIVFALRQKGFERGKWIIFWGLLLFWIIVSSYRAGGDMWDNPRYRYSLLIFFALMLSNTWDYWRKSKDHWMVIFYISEGIYLLFFSQWYISRYTNIFGKLDFLVMIGLIAGLIGIVFVFGLIFERKRFLKLNGRN